MDRLKTLLIFLLIGALCVTVGAFILKDRSGTYLETEALITRIVTSFGTGSDDDNTDVYVTYTVDGKTYEDILLNSYDASMKEGKTITVEYNVDDPQKLRTGHSLVAVIVLFVVGGLSLIYSLGSIIAAFVISKRQQ